MSQRRWIGTLFLLTWVMRACFTLEDVTSFLNTLPTERALEAKVIAMNSQRSFLGMFSTPYYVWYRVDR